MNVFVIHSGSDYDKVKQTLKNLRQKIYSLNSVIMEKRSIFWPLKAYANIKKSQMVLFVVGKKSFDSSFIAWEIKTAIKYNKPIYILKLDKDNQLHDALYVLDKLTNEKLNYGKEVSNEELVSIIETYNAGDYGLFNENLNQINQSIILEQYKLFLQTSEDLVDRRQQVNNFYISISSALAAFMGVIFSMNLDQNTKWIVGLMFCIVGIVVSISWSKILTSYGNLNSSKMRIISNIERQLPMSLFDAEWAALSDKLNSKKYVSFTESERVIPRLFGITYFFMMIFIAIFWVLQYISAV